MMSFFATKEKEYRLWDFLHGRTLEDDQIGLKRYHRLFELNMLSENGLELSCHDPETNKFTPWKGFYLNMNMTEFITAVDIHRNLLHNEVLIESDYPEYEENAKAIKVIGAILEEKGFIPHYYYSGGKSIHTHLWLDWEVFLTIPQHLQDDIFHLFSSKNVFRKKFIEWLREKCVNCWDLKIYKFDKQLVKSRHLIRSELSRNKRGFKTFLGYKQEAISNIPMIFNEDNKFQPILGEMRLSRPPNFTIIVEEFLRSAFNTSKKTQRQKNAHLGAWLNQGEKTATLRPCVQFILSDEFKQAGDGHQRAAFILVNELSKLNDENTTLSMLGEWNAKLSTPLLQEKLTHRISNNNTSYTLSCSYIHEFLQDIGLYDESKIKCARFK